MAPNPVAADGSAEVAGAAFLAGPQFAGGLTIPLGLAPLGLRVGAEFAWLHPIPVGRVLAQLEFRIRQGPGRRP